MSDLIRNRISWPFVGYLLSSLSIIMFFIRTVLSPVGGWMTIRLNWSTLVGEKETLLFINYNKKAVAEIRTDILRKLELNIEITNYLLTIRRDFMGHNQGCQHDGFRGQSPEERFESTGVFVFQNLKQIFSKSISH